MSSSTRPTYQQMVDVMRLMADVAALKGDPPSQRQLLIDGLNRVVGTNHGILPLGVCWRPGAGAHVSHVGSANEPPKVRSLNEVGAGMHQFRAATRPTPKQRALVLFAAEELERLARRGYLSMSSAQPADLPPRLRQVLDRLLCGRHPKGIARELGLSIWTVREHIERVYRYYGVSGRDELAARFISPSAAGFGPMG